MLLVALGVAPAPSGVARETGVRVSGRGGMMCVAPQPWRVPP